MQYDLMNRVPGISSINETVESQVFFGNHEFNKSFIVPAFLSGAARDSGGSPTTLLRPGLLMARITSSGLIKEWDPTATDGSEKIIGPLLYAENTQAYGTNQNKWFGYVAFGGMVKASELIVPGQSSKGLDGQVLEWEVRNQMAGRFMFDDYYHDHRISNSWTNQVVITGTTYTVTDTQNNTLFIVNPSGACTITLPAITASRGLRYGFYSIADQNMIIQSAVAGDLIGLGNAAADTLTFSTSSEKIGAMAEVVGYNNASWLCEVKQGTGVLA
jgi:hypothetical protein